MNLLVLICSTCSILRAISAAIQGSLPTSVLMTVVAQAKVLTTGQFELNEQGEVVSSTTTTIPGSNLLEQPRTSDSMASPEPTPTDTNASEEPYLGGEKNHMDPEKERAGVQAILDALTEEERAQMPDPGMPIRHFRAEKGDTKKAIEKTKAALKWRKDFGVDELVKCFQEEPDNADSPFGKLRDMMDRENASGKIYVRGYDKDGRALMIMRSSRENTHQEQDNMKHLVWNLEKAIACTAKKSTELGSPVPLDKINLVIDYAGFKLSNAPPMSTTKFTLDVLQKHYPERMYRIYCINPPFVFQAFWGIVRPFVDPVTKEKIVFCSGKKQLETNLHKNIAALDKLETVLGGPAPDNFESKTYLRLPHGECWDE